VQHPGEGEWPRTWTSATSGMGTPISAALMGRGPRASCRIILFYVLGADARVVKRLTLSADYLGQYFISALREGLQTDPTSNFTGISTTSNNFKHETMLRWARR